MKLPYFTLFVQKYKTRAYYNESYLPWVLYSKKLEFSLPKNGLCQLWLKTAKLFWGEVEKKKIYRHTDVVRKVIRIV